MGEVVGDVERLADLIGRLALDHVRDRLAADVEECLDVEIVRRQDDLEEHLLVHLHELLIPLVDLGRLLASIVVVVTRRRRVMAVVVAPLDDFAQDGFRDLSMRVSGLLGTVVIMG